MAAASSARARGRKKALIPPASPPHTRAHADFTTIARKIEAGAYSSLAAWVSDVELIIANCRKYNPPDSDMAALAAKIEAFMSSPRLLSEGAWANAEAVSS